MDIVVKGRNVDVPEHYRQLVSEKLSKLERYDHKLIRVDVALIHEPNRRQSSSCQRVEITCRSRGPVVRSEACAENFYTALDMALGKLEGRLRKSADRRRVHHGTRTPRSVASATADADSNGVTGAVGTLTADRAALDGQIGPGIGAGARGGVGPGQEAGAGDGDLPEQPGRIVREKEHTSKPMTIDQALFEMELVGHDFFLFKDVDSGRPTVVYRRHAYDYGMIRLAE